MAYAVKDPTQAPQEMWDDYYFALGKFMHMYSRVERSLHATALEFAKSRIKPTAPNGTSALAAVMGSPRLAVLLEMLTRLGRGGEQQAGLAPTIEHLKEISKLRNKLAHNAAAPDLRSKDGWFSVSGNNSSDVEKMETIQFKIQMLLDASRDLEGIPRRVELALELRNSPVTEAARQAFFFDLSEKMFPEDSPRPRRGTITKPQNEKRSPKQRRTSALARKRS